MYNITFVMGKVYFKHQKPMKGNMQLDHCVC